MSTAQTIPNQTSTVDLFDMGKLFADALRREGYSDHAQRVNEMLQKIPLATPIHFLTVNQVAGKLGLSNEMVYKIIKDGKFETVRIGDEFLIPQTELDPFTVLFEIDEEVPDVPMEEINAVMQEWRKDWTWIGKDD